MKRGVISLSGGMDSTCLLVKMIAEGYEKITAIGFDYGQSNKIELEKAKATIVYLKEHGFDVNYEILDISGLGKLLKSALTGGKELPKGHYKDEVMKSTVIPNRNVIFSSIIYGIAQSIASESGEEVDIVLGVQQGEGSLYKDSTPESREACEKAYKISNYDSHLVNYKTPYITFSKADIIQDLMFCSGCLGLDFIEVLRNTISSYDPDELGRSSGTSSSDIKRIEAFIQLGFKDPIKYVKPWDDIVTHAAKVLNT